jgi:choice-of-anchor B domain-containing protein
MRYNTIAGAVLTAASAVAGKELPKDEGLAAELYDTGALHERIMKQKMELWQGEHAAGLMNSAQWPSLNYTKCVNGKAEAIKGDPLHTFRCKNIDLYDFKNHADLGSPGSDAQMRTGSGSWGWVDPESGREFIANGQYDGTSFLEILPEGRIKVLGFLPPASRVGPRSLWKEVRRYKNYMLIGSELAGHGVQIFDLTKLLDVQLQEGDEPIRFSQSDLTGWFNELPVGSSHNVVVNEEAEYGASVGAVPRDQDCLGGFVFFDLKDPSNPKRIGCAKSDGYVHDAECLIYRGPDARYDGRDICYGYNEDSLTIYDVTDKVNPAIISVTAYEGVQYTHQGAVLDKQWQQYLLMDDEYDEVGRTGPHVGPAIDGYAATYIWDISDLEKPKQTGLYRSTVRSVDHNQYVNKYDGLVYQSNYGAGLRVYDVSSIPQDPTGDSVCEVAHFDIHPEDDSEFGGGNPAFVGSWSSYAEFPSGFVWINTIERGGYLVKVTKREACKAKTCSADNCLRALRSTSISGRLEESQEFCASYLDGWEADVKVVPTYAASVCGDNVIGRVSSACSCLPAATAAP